MRGLRRVGFDLCKIFMLLKSVHEMGNNNSHHQNIVLINNMTKPISVTHSVSFKRKEVRLLKE